MSWIKENKFLAGFTAATVVGAGALGFLTLQAKGRYDEATAAFEQESSELSRLQNAQPFPSPENVKKIEDQRKEHQKIINDLQQSLAKAELPVEQISPQQFQDRLRQTVDTTAKNAAKNNVKLPDKFAYSLERYLAEPPRPEAAPELGRQLKAMELAINKLIENHVTEIREFKREELAEERGGSSEAETPAKGGKGGKSEKQLVKLLPFEVSFFTDQGNFLMVLNSLVTAKEQFFIPRVITVKNEKDQGPPRSNPFALNPAATPAADPNATAGAVPGVPPNTATPGAPAAAPAVAGTPAAPAQPTSAYIVGEEKIDVTMRIEIADFENAPTTAAK